MNNCDKQANYDIKQLDKTELYTLTQFYYLK